MKKNLSTLICTFFIFFTFFATAQKELDKTKESSSAISKPNVTKPAPAKPTSVTGQKKHTPQQYKKPVSQQESHPQKHDATKLESTNPTATNSNISTQPSKHQQETTLSKSNTLATPASGVNKEAIHWNAYLKFRYQNYRDANNENRHCGCGADIELVNPTNDTIDVFLKYVSSMTLPTLDETAMPEIRRDFMYPTLFIYPGESVTIRGTCNGGILYEATSHFPKTKGRKNNNKILQDPKFIDHGMIRNNCIDKRIVFENEKQ